MASEAASPAALPHRLFSSETGSYSGRWRPPHAVPESNCKAVVAALRALQEKLRKLEAERDRATAEHFHLERDSLNQQLRMEAVRQESSRAGGVALSQLQGSLQNAEARSQRLELELAALRRELQLLHGAHVMANRNMDLPRSPRAPESRDQRLGGDSHTQTFSVESQTAREQQFTVAEGHSGGDGARGPGFREPGPGNRSPGRGGRGHTHHFLYTGLDDLDSTVYAELPSGRACSCDAARCRCAAAHESPPGVAWADMGAAAAATRNVGTAATAPPRRDVATAASEPERRDAATAAPTQHDAATTASRPERRHAATATDVTYRDAAVAPMPVLRDAATSARRTPTPPRPRLSTTAIAQGHYNPDSTSASRSDGGSTHDTTYSMGSRVSSSSPKSGWPRLAWEVPAHLAGTALENLRHQPLATYTDDDDGSGLTPSSSSHDKASEPHHVKQGKGTGHATSRESGLVRRLDLAMRDVLQRLRILEGKSRDLSTSHTATHEEVQELRRQLHKLKQEKLMFEIKEKRSSRRQRGDAPGLVAGRGQRADTFEDVSDGGVRDVNHGSFTEDEDSYPPSGSRQVQPQQQRHHHSQVQNRQDAHVAHVAGRGQEASRDHRADSADESGASAPRSDAPSTPSSMPHISRADAAVAALLGEFGVSARSTPLSQVGSGITPSPHKRGPARSGQTSTTSRARALFPEEPSGEPADDSNEEEEERGMYAGKDRRRSPPPRQFSHRESRHPPRSEKHRVREEAPPKSRDVGVDTQDREEEPAPAPRAQTLPPASAFPWTHGRRETPLAVYGFDGDGDNVPYRPRQRGDDGKGDAAPRLSPATQQQHKPLHSSPLADRTRAINPPAAGDDADSGEPRRGPAPSVAWTIDAPPASTPSPRQQGGEGRRVARPKAAAYTRPPRPAPAARKAPPLSHAGRYQRGPSQADKPPQKAYMTGTVASRAKAKPTPEVIVGNFHFSDVPFVVGTSTAPSHSIGGNLQQLLAEMKRRGAPNPFHAAVGGEVKKRGARWDPALEKSAQQVMELESELNQLAKEYAATEAAVKHAQSLGDERMCSSHEAELARVSRKMDRRASQMADILRHYRTQTRARPSMVAEAAKASAAIVEVDAGRLQEHDTHINRELLHEARTLQWTLKRDDVRWDT